MTKALHINWTACDGRGICTELLPGVLQRDDWGYPVAQATAPGERSNVPISPDLMDAARDAVRLCPRLALRLVEARDSAAEATSKTGGAG
ncbi:MAG: ferredoxin [Micrococcaceae bacterium]|nr:ferredoxin [Micrococcaceae bacterium]